MGAQRGANGSGWPLQRHFLARGTEVGLPRCQRHVASVITARRPALMIANHAPRDGRLLRAGLWLCSPVWCALRMGHGPGLVSDAAAEEGWSRRSSLRPRTLSRSPVATGSRTSRRGVQQSAPFCSAWHPVATPGMGASVGGRHERLAALLMPASSGNTWALPGRRRGRGYGVLP